MNSSYSYVLRKLLLSFGIACSYNFKILFASQWFIVWWWCKWLGRFYW